MNQKTRQIVLNIARLAISAGLLGWIVSQAGLKDLVETAQNADPRPYFVALLLMHLGIFVRAQRWRVLLEAVGVRLPFRRLAYLYFVGAFFNAFLPTGFGGDVVRVLEARGEAASHEAAGTVIVDRLTGFIAVFVFALVVLPFASGLLPASTAWLIALMGSGVMAGSVLLFEGKLLRRLTARLPRSLSLGGDAWVGQTYAVITACGRRAIAGALFWSLVFAGMEITANILVARALGLGASPWLFFLFVPVAVASLVVPISISGLGVRENIFVFLLGQVGVLPPPALAFSLGSYSLDLAPGLVGGVIYFVAGFMGLRPKK